MDIFQESKQLIKDLQDEFQRRVDAGDPEALAARAKVTEAKHELLRQLEMTTEKWDRRCRGA